MNSVPRDPEHYYPSQHATIRKRERGIEWADVSEAIANGTVTESINGENQVLFYTESVTAVANPECGEIITVAQEKPTGVIQIDP